MEKVNSTCTPGAISLADSGVLFYFPEKCVFDSSDPRNSTSNEQLENVMSTPNEPADPIAKGVIPTALQNLSDLLVWKQRVIVKNDFGEETRMAKS